MYELIRLVRLRQGVYTRRLIISYYNQEEKKSYLFRQRTLEWQTPTLKLLQLTTTLPPESTTEPSSTSKVPSSSSTTSSSPSKLFPIREYNADNSHHRYAEIVNVKLGDGSMRKGQVLEIAGKRAVVQVTIIVCGWQGVDLRRNLGHWQLAHSLRVHRRRAAHAHLHRDVGKVFQWFRYPHRPRASRPCWKVLRYPGKRSQTYYYYYCGLYLLPPQYLIN